MLGFTKSVPHLTPRAPRPSELNANLSSVCSYWVRGMATEVHSIPTPPTLLERRSGSRLQLLSDHPAPPINDARTQNNDGVTRNARGSFSTLTFTPLTPILASPALTPAINVNTAAASTSTNLNSASLQSDIIQNPSGGIQHKRSRSTLSRLHVTLPEDYFDAQERARPATVPTTPVSALGPGRLASSPPSSFPKDVILNGIPIVNTPPPAEDTASAGVDFPTLSLQVSVAPRLPRLRMESARKSFMLGSDDEDDIFEQQQKREAVAEAKKLERYDDLRRYHALMELLKTEAKYLEDLRILVDVRVTFW